MFGDVNCDGSANSIDSALILQLDAGVVDLLECGEYADVNIDGRANSLDAALILQYTAGIIDNLDPPLTSTPTRVTTPGQSATPSETVTPTTVLEPDATTTVVDLSTDFIVYDRFAQRVYAAVSDEAETYSSQIVSLTPAGVVEDSVSVGPDIAGLTLSGDGQYLYASIDEGRSIARVDLSTFSPGPKFAVGTTELFGQQVPLAARDMAVVPGRPTSLAVIRATKISADVAVYDDGVRRPETELALVEDIVFGESADRLYATGQVNLRVYELDETGVNEIQHFDTAGGQYETRFEAGLLYDSSGRATNPDTGELMGRNRLVVDDLRADGPVVPNATLGRVFYARGSNEGPRILSFDMSTFQPISVAEIDYPREGIIDFIGLSGNGFALQTSEQITIAQARLAEPDAPTVRISPPVLSFDDLTPGNKSTTQTILVQNDGPGPAGIGNVTMIGRNPEDFVIESDACSGRSLAPGTTCEIQLRFYPQSIGIKVAHVEVPNDALGLPDGVPVGGIGGTFQSSDSVHIVNGLWNDVVYDPATDLIYASSPSRNGQWGNHLVSVNPRTGTVQTSVWVGSEPDRLQLAEGGRHIFMAVTGSGAVRPFDTLMGLNGSQIPIGPGQQPQYGPRIPLDIAIDPRNSGRIAVVSHQEFLTSRAVTVHRDGILMPADIDFAFGENIEFGDEGNLYATSGNGTLARMLVDEQGVTKRDNHYFILEEGGYEYNLDAEFSEGLLYATSGEIFDPETLSEAGRLGANGVIEHETSSGRTFFFNGNYDWTEPSYTGSLRAFSGAGAELPSPVELVEVRGMPLRLIRLGTDGVAMLTDAGDLFIFHTQLTAE